jgi:serine/threonine-protein kinase
MAIDQRKSFGEYELRGVIGFGASGDVYRARRSGTDEVVALKIMRDAYAATDAELRRFRAGAAAAATLEHPGIVRVSAFGERDDVPFVAMSLVEGETLASYLARERPTAERAAQLMRRIAEAVAFAHGQGVLHRDLKPANILIDQRGEPLVADFGLVRRVDAKSTGGMGIVGAPAYLAPEQLVGGAGAERFPFAPDVYSLGVVFYEMLTGELPFTGGTQAELFARVLSVEPASPRERNPDVPPVFEHICLKCLEKDPARRYGSAGALADDLAAAPRGAPTLARAPTLRTRARRWARRHPRAALGLATIAALALFAGVGASALWRARAREQARVLETNAFIASGQAGAMLFQLRTYADRVERAARDPRVSAVLSRGEIIDPAPDLVPLAKGFDSLALETNDGRLIAQWPSPAKQTFGRTFDFRDYYQGARELAEQHAPGVYVSSAYRSESSGLLQFGLSTPVRDARGQPIGVLEASISARKAFGAVRIEGGDAAGVTTALLGPRGRDRDTPARARSAEAFTFLVHPGLDIGTEHTARAPSPEKLRAIFGDPAPPGEQFALDYVSPLKVKHYEDPIPGFEGPWLAALAPVGRTGFVVLVATRE